MEFGIWNFFGDLEFGMGGLITLVGNSDAVGLHQRGESNSPVAGCAKIF